MVGRYDCDDFMAFRQTELRQAEQKGTGLREQAKRQSRSHQNTLSDGEVIFLQTSDSRWAPWEIFLRTTRMHLWSPRVRLAELWRLNSGSLDHATMQVFTIFLPRAPSHVIRPTGEKRTALAPVLSLTS